MSKSISRTISKGQRDIELLGALTSNHSSQFNRVIARLEREARQIASEVLGRGDIEEAVSKAREKVIDWMRSDAPFKVSHPMAYATTLVRNAVIDYSRTTKERAIPEDQIKEDLAWIDGGMGYFGEDEEGDRETTSSGWHGVKVSRDVLGQDILKLPAIHWPEHHWLRALRSWNLGKCVGWLLPYSWSAEDYLFNKFRGTGVRVKPGMVNRLLKSEEDRRWTQYKLIIALIDNIPSLGEQKIMQYYLWGRRTVDIAKELDVTKAYISKVVNKWLKSWGWDKAYRDRARIILLTHYLATTYSKVAARIDQKKQQLYKTLPKDSAIEDRIDILTAEAIRMPIGERRRSSDKEAADMLYCNIIKATETKAYFSDLRESDNLALLEVCSTCYDYWYG